MKNLLVFLACFPLLYASAQQSIPADSWLLEASTGFVNSGQFTSSNPPTTGFGLITSDGFTAYSLGGEAAYFVLDNFGIKAGLGYSDFDGFNFFTYKVGAKYYLGGRMPFQVDITGISSDSFFDDPLWLGIQGGYAIFLNEVVALEPQVRYNISINDATDSGLFEIRGGFTIFFNKN